MSFKMVLLAGVAGFMTTPAFAQTTPVSDAKVAEDSDTKKPTDTDDEPESDVIVTGTRIARPNMVSNAPITVVDQTFLRERGIGRVEDALSQIPQVTPILGLQGNGWTAGRAGINLRRLGQGRTLTLLNGQRMDNDVNIVPGALIERIDILTGGASAVYGSDAIAGVVNFVLKRRFNGLVFDAEASGVQHRNDNATMLNIAEEAGYPRPQRNYLGAGQFFASLAGGKDFFDGRLNISAFATIKEAKPLQQFELDTTICPLLMNPLSPPLNSAGQPQFNNDTYACDSTEYNPYGYFGVSRDGEYNEYSNATNGSRTWRPFDPNDTTRVTRNDYIQRADKSFSAGGFLTAELFSDIKFDASFLTTRSKQSTEIAETAAFYTGDVAINCDNPFLSGQQASLLCGSNAGVAGAFSDPTVVVLWRENYVQAMTPRFWNWRGSAALSGTITGKIRFEANYQRSRDIFRNRGTNIYPYDFNQFARGLRVRNVNGVPTCLSKIDGTDPTCVPVDAFSTTPPSDEAWNWLTRTGNSWQQNDLEVYNGVVSGTLEDYGIKSPFATSGIGFAVVGELRNVRSQSAGRGAWSNWTKFDGKATVREIAAELDIPLIEDRPFARELSINGGYRLSDYTTYEKLVKTWKAEATWAPFDGLRFRGSYNLAVRVPVLERLEGENRYPNTFATDLCAPVGRATGSAPQVERLSYEKCAIGMTRAQYDALTSYTACNASGGCPAVLINGGNPQLQPERGRSYTIGLVLQPTTFKGFSATVDWYNIRIDGAFEWARWWQAFDQCYNQQIEFWCGMYRRDPQTGQLKEIDARYTNSGATISQGIDFSLNYLLDPKRLGLANDIGTFGLTFNGTLATKLERQFAPNTPFWSCVGYHGFGCGEPSPKWRHFATINWALPKVKAGIALTWRYIDGTEISKLSSAPNLKASPRSNNPDTYPLIERISPFSYFDIATNVSINQHLNLRFNVQNLLDKDPPMIGLDEYRSIGATWNTYPAYYTIRGRTLRVGLTARM